MVCPFWQAIKVRILRIRIFMSDLKRFRELLPRLSDARILCVGDVMVDHFIYGQVKRVSPEAPVPVLRAVRQSTVLGGAGNVARNLSSLSLRKSFFVSVVGEDAAAEEVSQLFSALEGVEATLIPEKNRKTTAKTRYVSEGQQLLRVDEEDSYPISEVSERSLIKSVENHLNQIDVLILSDYNKGVLTPHVIESLIGLANKHEIPVVVDPKKNDFSLYRGASLITPNAKELEASVSWPVSGDDDVVKATSELRERCGLRAILATRGAQGMTLSTAEDVLHIPTQALEIYDVSGAGDTVVAVVSACLAAGADLPLSSHLANLAAGVVVSKAGTAPVTIKELQESFASKVSRAQADKIFSWDLAKEQVIEWHRRGLRVGFANGCFDLLHPGHLSLIEQAKGACDRLIMALNTDASVQRLKGPTRPIQDERARAQIVAALKDVDLVVLFGEETPLALIQHLRPDVLVKGADYKIEDVVGAQEVISWGGEVVLAKQQEGFSTTSTVSKIAS